MTTKQIKNITIGSDPEVFLRNRETKEIISAIPYVPGDKYNPYQIPGLPEGCCIQTDNIMVEYCLPPTNNPEELYHNFRACVEYTNSIIPAELEVVIQASAIVNEEYLKDPQAQKFGCEPDFNAWLDGKVNRAPKGKSTNMRTAGGHIHIGYDNPDYPDQLGIIKAMDIFLGVPSIVMDPDKARKQMYGKAGAHRIKRYGAELRTLSNFWLQDLEHIKFIFKGIENAVEFFNSGKLDKLTDIQQLEVQACINTGDETLAMKLMNEFNLHSLVNKAEVYID